MKQLLPRAPLHFVVRSADAPKIRCKCAHQNIAEVQVSAGRGVQPPGKGADAKERIAWVHWQLDQFDVEKKLLLGRFQSLGPAARRQGGALPLALHYHFYCTATMCACVSFNSFCWPDARCDTMQTMQFAALFVWSAWRVCWECRPVACAVTPGVPGHGQEVQAGPAVLHR